MEGVMNMLITLLRRKVNKNISLKNSREGNIVKLHNMTIIPFESRCTEDLKKLGQSLRDYIVSLETREDDLVIYNTNTEIDEYISDFEDKKNTILLAHENNLIIGYGI